MAFTDIPISLIMRTFMLSISDRKDFSTAIPLQTKIALLH